MGKQAKYLYSVFVSLSVRKSSTIGRCYVQVPLGEPDQTVSETRVSDIVRWIRAGFRLFRGLSLVGSVLCQTLSLVGSGLSFPNPLYTDHGLCLRPDQTRPDPRGQSPYMSRLSGQVYDQTKSGGLVGDPSGP